MVMAVGSFILVLWVSWVLGVGVGMGGKEKGQKRDWGEEDPISWGVCCWSCVRKGEYICVSGVLVLSISGENTRPFLGVAHEISR